METLGIIRAIDALLTVAANLGISFARINEMRSGNEDGHLTEEQIQQLANEADETRAQL